MDETSYRSDALCIEISIQYIYSGADFDPEFFDVFGLNESFAFDMVDEMEADLIPDDPEELKEMCKSLLVEKMLMMMSVSMSMNLKEDGAVL